MKKIVLLALSVLMSSTALAATDMGFQFVLVVSQQGQDVVFVNDEISKQEFLAGGLTCKPSLEFKPDTVYDQTLGMLLLNCTNKDLLLQIKVTCSEQDPAAQTHFELGEGDGLVSFDLACKAKAR